ncbi:MAG TPA: hypothetical protein VK694_01215 [Verrucomicrobiae bacterium]|nr:hypothetical protein [Verrucomicrobiae bacterium]
MKVIFVGHPGSGKTYAADLLSKKGHLKKIDIDSLFDEHPLHFFLRNSYKKALHALLKNENEWVIDGYHGHRMPDSIWTDSDVIVFLNLPKVELKQNVFNRYRNKKSDKDFSHWQSTFVNVLKNLGQIYLLDKPLARNVSRIRSLTQNDGRLVELRSRQDLDEFIDTLVRENK